MLPRCAVPFYIIDTEDIVISKVNNVKHELPIWQKTNLTLEEAAAYSGIGINKIRNLSAGDKCPFVLWVGSKRLIKRRLFDEYIERQFSI